MRGAIHAPPPNAGGSDPGTRVCVAVPGTGGTRPPLGAAERHAAAQSHKEYRSTHTHPAAGRGRQPRGLLEQVYSGRGLLFPGPGLLYNTHTRRPSWFLRWFLCWAFAAKRQIGIWARCFFCLSPGADGYPWGPRRRLDWAGSRPRPHYSSGCCHHKGNSHNLTHPMTQAGTR